MGKSFPRAIPAIATAAIMIPVIAEAMWQGLTPLSTGVGRNMISITAISIRLNIQLPRSVPTARSGILTKAAALILVISSGIDVIADSSKRPIHIRPKPLFSLMASPYRARLVPEKRIMAIHAENFNQTNECLLPEVFYPGQHTIIATSS